MNPKSVFIKNLSTRTTPADIREIFGMFGGVRDVYIPVSYDAKRSLGRAFVEFTSPEEAATAQLCANGLILDGRIIDVEICRGDRKSSDHMRAKTSAPVVAAV
jgi:RNA recognition motif-containing protein